jgi:hypothetical protein
MFNAELLPATGNRISRSLALREETAASDGFAAAPPQIDNGDEERGGSAELSAGPCAHVQRAIQHTAHQAERRDRDHLQPVMNYPPLRLTWEHDAAHGSLRRLPDLGIRLCFLTAGFSPIIAIAVMIFSLAPLPVAALSLIVPSASLAMFCALRFPEYGRLALHGFLAGIAAVFCYDLFRIPFILTGIWPDFIPQISVWLLGVSQPIPAVGYIYRYVGDGGGMAMAFALCYPLVRRQVQPVRAALSFGVAVWCGLMATLIIAPHGQDLLFRLTPFTLVLSLAGHLIYGSTIGLVLRARFSQAGCCQQSA